MILEVKNASFHYKKETKILNDINLTLNEGMILSVLGPNGVGKTTLIKCIIGLLPWTSGASYLYGKDISKMSPKELWTTVSYIPQAGSFSFSYTGLEMVLMGRSVHLGTFEQPGQKDLEMSMEMMEKIKISHLAHKDCNRMSGGELQMVLIARALVSNPKVLILDEPEGGLDFRNQLLVLNLIDKLAHEDKISAIMNTHYPKNALSISDQSLMLQKNKGYFYGNTEQILTPENIEKAFRVGVIMSENRYKNKMIKDIVPVEIL